MARPISKRNYSKASTSTPLGNPPPENKPLGLGPDIFLYEIEDGDNNEEGEYLEILTIKYKSLPSTKQNLVKRNLPYIDTFNHMGTYAVRTMRNLTSGVFEDLEITSPMYVDKRVNYTQRLIRG